MGKNKKTLIAEFWTDSDGEIWFDPTDQLQQLEQLNQLKKLTEFHLNRKMPLTKGQRTTSRSRKIKTRDKKSKR